jgi:hypothetical protein
MFLGFTPSPRTRFRIELRIQVGVAEEDIAERALIVRCSFVMRTRFVGLSLLT